MDQLRESQKRQAELERENSRLSKSEIGSALSSAFSQTLQPGGFSLNLKPNMFARQFDDDKQYTQRDS